jgi:hypothetical protein
MLGLKHNLSKSEFNSRILTTFGKLDDRDIADINGCSKRLVTYLMDRYAWSPAYAQIEADRFDSNLLEGAVIRDRLTY